MKTLGSLMIGVALVAGQAAAQTTATVAPPTMTKQFGAANIPLNGTTSLTLTVTNPGGNVIPLTGVAFADNLPTGLLVATPSGLSNSCGGTVAADAGDDTVTLSNVTLAVGGSCTVALRVQATTAGIKNNSVTPTSNEGGTGAVANALITVVGPPSIIKAFGAESLPLGSSTSLTFTLQNTNATRPLTGIGFSDSLPSGLIVATPNGLTGSCGGGTITAPEGGAGVNLSGAMLSAGISCTFSINVTGTTAGFQFNITGNVTSVEGGTGLTASASIFVVVPPELSKDFAPAVIPLGGTTTLTFTIDNENASTPLTGIAFTDTLPAGLVVATPGNPVDNCPSGFGTFTAADDTSSISLTGESLGPMNSCTLTVNVTTTPTATTGEKINTTGNITALESGPGGIASAVLIVAFTDDPLVAGVTPIKAVHITELRNRIDTLRSVHGLGAYTYADPTLVVNSTAIAAQHVLDLRAALAEVYVAIFGAPPTYVTPAPSSGGSPLASYISDLRAKVIAIE